MTHTPGPWFVKGQFIGPRLSEDSGIQLKVARVAGDETDAEADANAHLIAAAPDLLEALVEAAEFIQPFNRAEDLLDRIDAAIAKATGRGDERRAQLEGEWS